MIFLNYAGVLFWLSSFPKCRSVYENPPNGITTLISNLVDRYINTVSFHMIKLTVFNVCIYELSWLFSLAFALLSIREQFPKPMWCDDESIGLVCTDKILRYAPFIVLCLSAATSILFACFVKKFEYECTKFPLQISVERWKVLLNKNWNREGRTVALLTLQLAVCNWAFKTNSATSFLGYRPEYAKIFVDYNALNDAEKCEPETVLTNINIEELIKFKIYLASQTLLTSNENRCAEHIINSFGNCLQQMTSYRIFQTFKIINNVKNGESLLTHKIAVMLRKVLLLLAKCLVVVYCCIMVIAGIFGTYLAIVAARLLSNWVLSFFACCLILITLNFINII